jgi:hypothetical protein
MGVYCDVFYFLVGLIDAVHDRSEPHEMGLVLHDEHATRLCPTAFGIDNLSLLPPTRKPLIVFYGANKRKDFLTPVWEPVRL